MTGVLIRDGHQSSKFSAPPESLYRSVRKGWNYGWSVQSFTEVDHAERGRMLYMFDHTVTCRGPAGATGESAILWDSRMWKVLAWEWYIVADDLIGMRGKQVMVIAAARHRETGLIYLRSVTHTASGVEAVWAGARIGARAVQYQSAMREWRRIVRRWRRKWRPDGEWHAGDMNLNLLRRWVRTYFHATWPGMRLPAHGDKGSHGPRLIDFGLGRRLRDLRLRVVHGVSGASDHDPVGMTARLVPRRWRRKR